MIAGSPRTPAWKLTNLWNSLALLVEHRLCARELDRDRDGVGAHHPGLLAQIGLRDDQRVLDHPLGLFGEQPVEAAIERHAGDDGHQDRRHRGDDRKQRRRCAHAAVSRRGRAAAPGPPARLPADDAEQQQHGHRVAKQHGDDDVMGRRDRREVGQYQEGDAAPTAAPARPRPRPAGAPTVRERRSRQRQAPRWRPGRRWSSLATTDNAGVLHERDGEIPCPPAQSDAFVQQCCRIATIPGPLRLPLVAPEGFP